MSDHATTLCNFAHVRAAVAAARGLNETIRHEGIAYDGANEALRALQRRYVVMLGSGSDSVGLSSRARGRQRGRARSRFAGRPRYLGP